MTSCLVYYGKSESAEMLAESEDTTFGACYNGYVFGNGHGKWDNYKQCYVYPKQPPFNFFHSYYFVDSKKLYPMANWWLKNVYLPFIPDRCKPAFKLQKLNPKIWKAVLERSKGEHRVKQQIPWVTLTLDAAKICANDAYFMLAFLRDPMEEPKIIEEAYKFYKTYDCTPEQAFLIIAACGGHYDGHGSLVSYFAQQGPQKTSEAMGQVLKAYSIKKKWTEGLKGVDTTGKPWQTKVQKTDGELMYHLQLGCSFPCVGSPIFHSANNQEDFIQALQLKKRKE